MMRERPILFSGPMVRALLADAKTQTRRVVNLGRLAKEQAERARAGDYSRLPCPYGVPGDRLWVREAFATDVVPGAREVIYRADQSDASAIPAAAAAWRSFGWAPSIFMPRWASRVTLEVTGVRVERLQDISEEDAAAEGIEPDFGNAYTCAARDYRRAFERGWDTINGTRAPWASNPWVWAVEFRRLASAEAAA